MRPLSYLSAAGALAAVAALTGGVAPDGAAAAVPEASLVLLLREGDALDAPLSSSAMLTCAPDGGTHRKAHDACQSLRMVDGRFEHLITMAGPCPFIYAPVTAEARGVWRGRDVVFSRTYPNQCVAETESGGVFAY